MDKNIEISNEVFERLRGEEEAFFDELSAQGKKEGMDWAKSASYADLYEMQRMISKKYYRDPGSRRFSGQVMVNDPKLNEYWRNVLLRYPLIAEIVSSESEGSDMDCEVECFFGSWLLAIIDFYLRFQLMVVDYANKIISIHQHEACSQSLLSSSEEAVRGLTFDVKVSVRRAE